MIKKIGMMPLMLCIMLLTHSIVIQSLMHINQDQGLYGLKILHLGFQLGCIKDFEEVAKELGLDVTSWYILSGEFPRSFFDGCDCGNQIYNISTQRARKIWELHKDFFEQFDVVMTSDTAPLLRIFVENGWKKPLIVWICNRFDYSHQRSDCGFPDAAYYKLVNSLSDKKNVHMIPYTDYEWVYAQKKKVDFGQKVIRPVGSLENKISDSTFQSAIPASIDKKNNLFLYPRFDSDRESHYILNECAKMGIQAYCGPYNGPDDLCDFKGVLYFPYAWSNIALFEDIQRGIIHFVPTAEFLKKQAKEGYPIRNFTQGLLCGPTHHCEWYQEELQDLFVYFDSWEDLRSKYNTIDYTYLSEHIKKRAQELRKKSLSAWMQLFDTIAQQIQN